ncbi:hypothetical protein HYS96_04920 [Candidatus Daviesbacteria bacterium]|nr:hypothetical protein [Candidatus Daviesbacteria bacterium]
MAHRSYRYNRRAVRRIARRNKRNFIISLFLVLIFTYVALIWILPNFIRVLGSIKEFITPPIKKVDLKDTTVSLAPPIFNIPYEATNTAQINIQGYATPESKVKLFLDDEEKQTEKSSSDGSFTFQNIQLGLGVNNIYGKTLDENGQMSLPSKTIKVIFDNEKPLLEVSEPLDGKTIQGERKIKIAGKTEPKSQIYINGNQIIVDKEGNFSSERTLNDGENNFTIKAYDSSANFSEISRKVIFTP